MNTHMIKSWLSLIIILTIAISVNTNNKPPMSSSSSSSTTPSSSNSPCAACKFLRRKCMPGCTFAPYFPPDEPQKFVNVHKIFGASNVSKLLNEVLPHQREDTVSSLAYEAEARVKDPVYGCVGAISVLQRQVLRLQKELDKANSDLIRYASNATSLLPALPPAMVASSQHQIMDTQFDGRAGGGGGRGGLHYYPSSRGDVDDVED